MALGKIDTFKRPFDVIFLIDTSYSMKDSNIQSVNEAMPDLSNELQKLAKKKPLFQYNIRIITFGGDKAKWHTGNEKSACPIEKFNYKKIDDSELGGGTPLGDAFGLLCQVFENPKFSDRSLTPLISIISDGKPTDRHAFESNLKRFLSNQWGNKAIKTAVAIGDADREILAKFTGELERVKFASNAEDIFKYIKWVSDTIVKNDPKPLKDPDSQLR